MDPRAMLLLRHTGLAMAALGALSTWAVVGGRARNGMESAELLLTLSSDGISDGLGWIGWLWYAAASLTLLSWAVISASEGSGRRVGHVGLGLSLGLLVAHAVAVGALTPLQQRFDGLALALAGVAAMTASELLPRKQPTLIRQDHS